MKKNEFLWPVRVYIEDTDAGGIVYYVNYLRFLERARTEFLRSLGFNKAGANKESFQFVVHSVKIDYKRPAFLDDALQITVEVIKVGGATTTFIQRVLRDDCVLASGEVRIACVDGTTLRPTPIPKDVKCAMASHLSNT